MVPHGSGRGVDGIASMHGMADVPRSFDAGDGGMVQLSVRVPPALRSAARRRAAAVGLPLRDFVQRAIEVAVAEPSVTPEELGEARRCLADAYASGDYRRYVESIDDPDLMDS